VKYTVGQWDTQSTVRSSLFVEGLGIVAPKPSRTQTFLRFRELTFSDSQ
jgi:hypothetical protein